MKTEKNLFVLLLFVSACSEFKQFDGASDVNTTDGDVSVRDGGSDSASDAGSDAEAGTDARSDTGSDTGLTDAGPDTGSDTGPDVPDVGPIADLPITCADIHRASPAAPDGMFILYAGRMPSRSWQVYCHDLAGSPIEYLPIPTGIGQNFSQYTAGGDSPGTNVRTVYRRIRIDPMTFRIDTGDQRFASSTGMLTHSNTSFPTPVSSMPYAVAADCTSGGVAGIANVDLRGTPFRVIPDGFMAAGYTPAGTAMYSSGDQVVDLRGGGFCGWELPRPGVPSPYNATGGSILQLVYR